jgi:hypothetical protein
VSYRQGMMLPSLATSGAGFEDLYGHISKRLQTITPDSGDGQRNTTGDKTHIRIRSLLRGQMARESPTIGMNEVMALTWSEKEQKSYIRESGNPFS